MSFEVQPVYMLNVYEKILNLKVFQKEMGL